MKKQLLLLFSFMLSLTGKAIYLQPFDLVDSDYHSSDYSALYNYYVVNQGYYDDVVFVKVIKPDNGVYDSSVNEIGWAYEYTSDTGSKLILVVRCIGAGAFADSKITSMTLPQGGYLRSIDDAAFDNCGNLSKINIPEGVTNIGIQAFRNCSRLNSITLPESLTSIGKGAFFQCIGLTGVRIPSGVTSIGDYAFYNCFNLEKVIAPDIAAWCHINFGNETANPLYYACNLYKNNNTKITNLVIPKNTDIGNYAFVCGMCLNSVKISEGAFSIGNSAFYGCANMTSVTIPSSVWKIGDKAFSDCYELKSVTLPEGVVSIGSSAFYQCTGLTSMTIPSSVNSIGSGVFDYCNLISLTVNCPKIGAWFSGQNSLKTITLGSEVSEIAGGAFSNCSKLEDVFCYAVRYPSVTSTTFEGSYIDYVTLYVPAESLEKYKRHEVWGQFWKVVPIEEASGIVQVDKDADEMVEIYDLSGKRQENLAHGVNIIRMKDGSTRKVLVK